MAIRRFPKKLIPLYSAGHDDYASKQQPEVGTTRGERAKSCLTDKSREGEFSTLGTVCHHLT